MSSIDIYAVLEKFRCDWDHGTQLDRAVLGIDSIVEHLRAAEQTGYLGTLYRTDFEVAGAGVFPIDAKLLDVSLYDVLKGTALPDNTCPHCGGALSNAKEP